MKTTLIYDNYYNYAKLSESLELFATQYPKFMKLSVLAKTKENKNVWAVAITNLETGDYLDKPALYVDGNHHAGEVMGSMAALHIIDYLLTNHENDVQIQKLLASYTIYVIPRISPDGCDEFLHEPTLLRSVNTPYPLKEKQAGLNPCDLDGDGVIRLMRVKSPYGVWKTSTTNNQILVPREADDIDGTYYLVYPEGEILNYDGHTIPSAPAEYGLDFNRNYPFGWFCEGRQQGAGPYPLSNIETKSVADFVIDHPNIMVAMTLHTSGGMIVYPPGVHPEKEAHPFDMSLYRAIGKIGTKATSYPAYNVFDAFLTDTVNYSSGAFDDWCYFTQGILAYTIEFWDLLKQAGVDHIKPVEMPKDIETLAHYHELKLNWINEHADLNDQFKPWTTIVHPQLGEVEVGGYNPKFTIQNCPPQFLQEEIEKNTSFMVGTLQTFPNVCVESVDVKAVCEDIFEVTLVIGNSGYLPTYVCEQAKSIKVDKPLTISCDGLVVSGDAVSTIGHLEGRSALTASYGYSQIQTSELKGVNKAVTYLIKGKTNDCVTFNITSEKVGNTVFTVTLSETSHK